MSARTRLADASYVLNRVAKDSLLRIPAMRAMNRQRAAARTGPTTELDYNVGILRGHVDRATRAGVSLTGSHVLELGPGQTLAQSLLCRLFGARSVMAVDVEPYAAMDHPVYSELLAQAIDPGRTWEFPAELSSQPVPLLTDTGHLVLNDDLRYEITGGKLPLEDDSIDLVFSTSVLEHVPDIQALHRELARVMRPGAVGTHIVDLKDHIRDDPLDMLRYRRWLWHLMQGHSPGYINRHRLSDHLAAVQQAGLEVVDVDERYLKTTLQRDRLQTSFQKYSDEELRVIEFIMVVRKP